MASPARYSFIFSKIKAQESRLFPCAKLKSLLRAKSVAELSHQLEGTYYQEMFASGREPEERENIIWEKDISLHKKLAKYLKGKERKVIELFLERYDVDKIKAVLRAWYGKDKSSLRLLSGRNARFSLDAAGLINAADIDDFIALLKGTPYKPALEEARAGSRQNEGLFYWEWALENDYLKRTAEAVRALPAGERNPLMKIWGLEVDMANVSFALKAARYYSKDKELLYRHFLSGGGRITKEDMQEASLKGTDGFLEHILGRLGLKAKAGGESGPAAGEGIEYLLSYIVMQRARAALGGYPFSLAVVAAFLVLKYLETKNIISIFYACFYGLDKSQAERLVVC